MAGNDASIMRREPDLVGLGDQVSDGEDKSVLADHDAAALAQGAEASGGEGIFGHLGPQGDD